MAADRNPDVHLQSVATWELKATSGHPYGQIASSRQLDVMVNPAARWDARPWDSMLLNQQLLHHHAKVNIALQPKKDRRIALM